jgi:hypothetical protein
MEPDPDNKIHKILSDDILEYCEVDVNSIKIWKQIFLHLLTQELVLWQLQKHWILIKLSSTIFVGTFITLIMGLV